LLSTAVVEDVEGAEDKVVVACVGCYVVVVVLTVVGATVVEAAEGAGVGCEVDVVTALVGGVVVVVAVVEAGEGAMVEAVYPFVGGLVTPPPPRDDELVVGEDVAPITVKRNFMLDWMQLYWSAMRKMEPPYPSVVNVKDESREKSVRRVERVKSHASYAVWEAMSVTVWGMLSVVKTTSVPSFTAKSCSTLA